MKHTSNLTAKFEAGKTFTQMIVSLVQKKYKYLSLTGTWFQKIGRAKTVKNFICGKLIYGPSLQALVLYILIDK